MSDELEEARRYAQLAVAFLQEALKSGASNADALSLTGSYMWTLRVPKPPPKEPWED